MASTRVLVWFRGKDLRVHDHPALAAATQPGLEPLCVFVASRRYLEPRGAAGAPHRVQYLLDALAALERALAERGGRLAIVAGPAREALPALAAAYSVARVHAMRTVEPSGRAQEEAVARALPVPLELFDGETLAPPGSLRSSSGEAYAVYTPFARGFLSHVDVPSPGDAPEHLPCVPPARGVRLEAVPGLESLGLARNERVLPGGEPAAQARLAAFLRGPVDDYDTARDRMDLPGTSRLSADLRFGAISVREVWHAVKNDRFRRELLWREFAHHTLYARPELLRAPFRAGFAGFPWRSAPAEFEAWAHGATGYPLVDAAARQLTREGFVHNRARMVAASFLTKHLLISYRKGEAHYLKYLTDGDLAQNNMGWQWCAGTGCDAQPYFRIFNPVEQGKRFDPEGVYVRRYVPELAQLPVRYIHAPWLAPANQLARAGVVLGKTYPRPIVDHADARRRYLLVANEHLKRG